MVKFTQKVRTRKQVSGKKKQGGRRLGGNNEVTAVARMLNDPCGAPLAAPQYGASSGGYLTKLSNSFTISADVGGSGYIVWFPDYSGRRGEGNYGNLFIFQSAVTTGHPTNTLAEPLGAATQNTADSGGYCAFDPAYAFVESETVQDSRTAAGCMRLLYTGRNDALSGRVGVLHGFSRDALFSGNTDLPPTIGQMFAYATEVSRTPMDHVEVKFKPTEGSDYYRSTNDTSDVAFSIGTAGTTNSELGTGTPGSVGTGIGYVWSGLDSSSTMTFDFLKCIEWRPEFGSNISSPPQTVSASGGNVMSRAVAYLDHHLPGWHQTLTKSAGSAAATIAKTAFQGPMNQFIKSAGLDIAAMAPMMLAL